MGLLRKVGVEVVADVDQLVHGFRVASQSAKSFSEQISIASATSAKIQVEASVKAQTALREEIAAYGELAASATRGSREQIAATNLQARAQQKLARSNAVTAEESLALSKTSRRARGEIDRATRGALAGTGIFRAFGRSLAFASGGFLAFAGASTLLRASIQGADSLEGAQKSLAVAIQHTGGNLDRLKPKYEKVAQAAQQFGINQADATTGLERATVLTGSAVKAQRAYQEALVISKATGKDFNSVLIATSKGQSGITTSLRRYVALIGTSDSGTEQFTKVMARFGGQAKANTSGIDVFNATLQNTEAIVGTTLLPVLDKYLGQLGDWLDKMDRTGRLQKDVNSAVHDGVAIFGAIGSAIKAVDAVTGSFKNTLEILLGLKVASVVAGWAGSFKGLAGAETAASGAALGRGAAARTRAGAAVGAAAGVIASNANIIAISVAVAIAILKNPQFNQSRDSLKSHLGHFGFLVSGPQDAAHLFVSSNERALRPFGLFQPKPPPAVLPTGKPFFTLPGINNAPSDNAPSKSSGGPFGKAKPIPVYKTYAETISEQVAVAQSALTKTPKDDVIAAKAIIARIKKQIDKGHLQGASLVGALQDEAAQQGVLNSARQAAAQRAAKIAAAKKAAASSYTTSIDLQIAQVQAEMTKGTADDKRVLKQEIAQARAALASGKKNKQGRLAALQVILGAQQSLQGLTGQSATSYTLPAKLQLQLAKAQATGKSIVPVLVKMKAALEKALKAAHGNIQKQIDIYNQIASVNDQLKSSATTGLNGFKQASTRALTANLGLTAAQRAELRARLSQRGPGGTVPGKGVGAGGYVIGANDRPIVIHHTTKLDGKVVERNTTRHQQKRHRRSSHQRRGPHAGI